MRCGSARVFIQETLDGPLSPPDEAMLEAHMAGCDPCRQYRQHLSRAVGALEGLAGCGAPRDFAAAIQFRLGQERGRRRWAPLVAAAAVVAGFLTLRPMLDAGTVQVARQDLAITAMKKAEVPARAPAAPHAAVPQRPRSEPESAARVAAAPPPPMPAAAAAYRSESAGEAAADSFAGPTGRRSRPATERHEVDMATFEILRWMDPAADGGPNFEVQEVEFVLP